MILAGLTLLPAFINAQEDLHSQYLRRFQNGSQFYNMSRWQEAAIEFRRAQEIAAGMDDWSRALYWVILSQMAYSDFGSALMDMEELDRRAPNSPYTRDMVYHRARLYYEQGYYEDAILLFNRYNSLTTDSDRETSERRAAAFFWIGECLYSIGEFDEAEKFYSWVVGRYPTSPKVEASAYRLDIIKQKKIEAELLALLQWSHEESLRTSEEYQRTIRTYESTLNMYQRRIAELTGSETRQEINSGGQDNAPLNDASSDASRNIIPMQPYIPAQEPERSQMQKETGSLQDMAILLENRIQEILSEHGAGGYW